MLATGFIFSEATLRDETRVIFTGSGSWNLVIFNKTDGRISSVSGKIYDLYGNPAAPAEMGDAIAAIPAGTDVCIFITVKYRAALQSVSEPKEKVKIGS